MKIKNIMTRDVVTLKTASKNYEAQEIMKDNDIGFIPILEEKKIIGVITDKDLVKKEIENFKNLEQYYNKLILDIINPVFDFVYEDSEEEDVYKLMKEKQRRRFPVVDEKKNLVGIISITDLNIERISKK